MFDRRGTLRLVLILTVVWSASALAQLPNHPIITEVFNNPPGTSDGPTGRTLSNPHQEFIEIYLPTAAALRAGLNKDALHLTYYEIEGNSGNLQRGSVNQRFDLPTFDLDSSNGITAGAVARPSSGVVVLGWVDYNAANPPTGLAGTPSTRVALINGGVTTSPPGALFVAMNGAQFTGTTNFPVPTSESTIDVPDENTTGCMSNGSDAYLLINRDDPGYVQLFDRKHPELGAADASLATGTILQLSALLDGLAGNDDSKFSEASQPYAAPTGLNIDLEDVLPLGGVFSAWVAQVSEGTGDGYLRRLLDVRKTTEDATVGNEDPAADAQTIYRSESQSGPFFPTPGKVVTTTSPPELSVASSAAQTYEVLASTTGRPGLRAANVGGNFGIDITATPGASSNPTVATFAAAMGDVQILGQLDAFPQVAITVPATAPEGATATANVAIAAANSTIGQPAVLNPNQNTTITVTARKPTTGKDATGLPYQATVFAAIEGLGADVAVRNEFLSSDLGLYAAPRLAGTVRGSLGHMTTLLSSETDLESFSQVELMQLSFPATEAGYINAAGPVGHNDLVGTVLNSGKVLSGSTVYSGSVNGTLTAIKAIEIKIPETFTKGGAFSTDDTLFFADATGDVFGHRSGLSYATTTRTFELALLDTNTTSTGLESGDSDDFGLIVIVGQVRAGASVVPGQFVFLSYMGGFEGEDIDTLDAPGANATNVILLDLDNLDDVLGCKSITDLFVIDGDGNGTINVIEALSLNATGPCQTDGQCDNGLYCDGVEHCVAGVCQAGTPVTCADAIACTTDTCSEVTKSCQFVPNHALCSDGLFCNGAEVCDPILGCLPSTNPCANPNDCDEAADSCGCDPPTVAGAGSRYLRVTPTAGANRVALQVRGNSGSVSCVNKYVQANCQGGSNAGAICSANTDCPGGLCNNSGTLGTTAVYRTPAEWGTVAVRSEVIGPLTAYDVRADCGTTPGVTLSAPATGTTWKWGDTNANAIVNFQDVSTIVAAFQSGFTPTRTLESVDLTGTGCLPNRLINFQDVSADVAAFQGKPFTYCSPPCP